MLCCEMGEKKVGSEIHLQCTITVPYSPPPSVSLSLMYHLKLGLFTSFLFYNLLRKQKSICYTQADQCKTVITLIKYQSIQLITNLIYRITEDRRTHLTDYIHKTVVKWLHLYNNNLVNLIKLFCKGHEDSGARKRSSHERAYSIARSPVVARTTLTKSIT